MAKDFESLVKSIKKRSNDFVGDRSILPVAEKAVCVYIGKNTVDVMQREITESMNYVLNVTYAAESIFCYSVNDMDSLNEEKLYNYIVEKITGGYNTGSIFVYFISLLEASDYWDKLCDEHILTNIVNKINEITKYNGINNVNFDFIGIFPFMSMGEKNVFYNSRVLPVLREFDKNENTNIIHIRQVERDNVFDVCESIAFYICSKGADVFRESGQKVTNDTGYTWHNFHVLSNNINERIITTEIYKAVKCRENEVESPSINKIKLNIKELLNAYMEKFVDSCMTNISDSDYKFMPYHYHCEEKTKGIIFKKTEVVNIGDAEEAFNRLVDDQKSIVAKRKKNNTKEDELKTLCESIAGCCDRYVQFNDIFSNCINEIRPKDNEHRNSSYTLEEENRKFFNNLKNELKTYILDEIENYIKENIDSIKNEIKTDDNKLREYINSYLKMLFLTTEISNSLLGENSVAFNTDYLKIAENVTNQIIEYNLEDSEFSSEISKYYGLLVGNIGTSSGNIITKIMFTTETRDYANRNDINKTFKDNIKIYVNKCDTFRDVPIIANKNIKENNICAVYDNYITNYLPWED